MATIIPARGPLREIVPANGRSFSLAELQAIVGGYLEALRAPDGRIVFLNEDGKRLQLPINYSATWLLRHQIGGDHIVGDVVLCTEIEAGEGDDAEASAELGLKQGDNSVNTKN